MNTPTRMELFERGLEVIAQFARINDLPHPGVTVRGKAEWPFDPCAYYRPAPVGIEICIDKCASPMRAGRQWSWPGYVIDRTPYGVLAHEFGHHVDCLTGNARGAYWSDYSSELRSITHEPAITSYAPNDAEWFAEIFRLFITNPNLLFRLAPQMHWHLNQRFQPVFSDTWPERLVGAPERFHTAAANKVTSAELASRSFGSDGTKPTHTKR